MLTSFIEYHRNKRRSKKNETPKGFRETAFRQILSAFRFSGFSIEDFLSRIVCGQNEKTEAYVLV